MGSNAINLVEEDLCCPVCKKSLSSPGSPPKNKRHSHKQGRGKGRAPHLNNTIHSHRETKMAVGKFKDNEEIVVAQCGHLFHKFCLRHYCYLVREGRSNHMYKVNCPMCQRHISMSSQAVDYRSHQDRPNDRDKDFTKTSVMNNELSDQMIIVQQRVQNVESAVEDENHNFRIYRSHWRKLRKELKNIKVKRLDIENLYTEIERSEQMLKCMQSQQLKIVKKFIMRVKEKAPKDFIHFPRRLAPFLEIIRYDDRLIRDLGEVIVPIRLNHLKSDRHSLLKGIISRVQSKLAAEGKTIEIPASTPDQSSINGGGDYPKKPSIFVKVRKSSISILSSSNLTRESIQQIIKNVDIPLRESRKLSKAAINKKKVRISDKVPKKEVNKMSTTDIQVLYMPKRNIVEPTSQPCRTMEADSCVMVPVRRCRSTNAVLMKSKKTKGPSTYPQVDKRTSKSMVCERRSNSATVIMSTPSKNVQKKLSSSQNGTLSNKVNEPKKLPLRDADCIKSLMKDYDSCTKNLNEMEELQDNANNNRISGNLTYRVDYNGNADPETALKEDSKETVSLLKLIYDNLEEEHNSTINFSYREKCPWADQDINSDAIKADIRPLPQFFRVDRRGIARPETPQTERFHQPTFLSTNAPNCEKSGFMLGTFIPDEENQINALSSDDRLMIATDQEAILSSRSTCGNSSRRSMFHGVPACMGMPNGNSNNLHIPPDALSMPFYLKKWQQQLTSRKMLKAVPRRVTNGVLKSTRVMHSPRYNATNSFKQPNVSTYQRYNEMRKLSPSPAIHLPPLSMYPAKRPPTAKSEDLPESGYHREGPEREIGRMYDYKKVWN